MEEEGVSVSLSFLLCSGLLCFCWCFSWFPSVQEYSIETTVWFMAFTRMFFIFFPHVEASCRASSKQIFLNPNRKWELLQGTASGCKIRVSVTHAHPVPAALSSGLHECWSSELTAKLVAVRSHGAAGWAVSLQHHLSCLNTSFLLPLWRSVLEQTSVPPFGVNLLIFRVPGTLKWIKLLILFWSMKGQCMCFVSQASARSAWYRWSVKMLSRSLKFRMLAFLYWLGLKINEKKLKFELFFKWNITFNVFLASKIIGVANWYNFYHYSWIFFIRIQFCSFYLQLLHSIIVK